MSENSISCSGITANMMVEDVNATAAFYQRMLGFSVLDSVPEKGRFDWARLGRDTISIMVQESANLIAEYPSLVGHRSTTALTLFIEVRNLDALHNELAAKLPLTASLHETFYGMREFAVTDCNGIILTFAEPIDRPAQE